MCYNNCEICQFNEDFATAKALLQKALTCSIYTLMVKTEEAEAAKALAEKEFRDFMFAHQNIDLGFILKKTSEDE